MLEQLRCVYWVFDFVDEQKLRQPRVHKPFFKRCHLFFRDLLFYLAGLLRGAQPFFEGSEQVRRLACLFQDVDLGEGVEFTERDCGEGVSQEAIVDEARKLGFAIPPGRRH